MFYYRDNVKMWWCLNGTVVLNYESGIFIWTRKKKSLPKVPENSQWPFGVICPKTLGYTNSQSTQTDILLALMMIINSLFHADSSSLFPTDSRVSLSVSEAECTITIQFIIISFLNTFISLCKDSINFEWLLTNYIRKNDTISWEHDNQTHEKTILCMFMQYCIWLSIRIPKDIPRYTHYIENMYIIPSIFWELGMLLEWDTSTHLSILDIPSI